MALNPNRPRQLPGGVLLVILCLLSIALMTIWAREGTNGPLHQLKAGVETVAMPFKTAGSIIATPFTAVADFFEGITTDAMTVKELRRQNEELQSQIIRMEEYRQENERLSGLLELKDAYRLESVGARVISTSSDSWNRVITINKGSIAGFEVGMPVLSANGLIGQIESVSPYSSVVRLITDAESGVSAFLQSSRAEGVLSGSVDGILSLDFIPLSVAVAPGDTVITSGAGGVYPKGIPIGEVVSVKSSPSDAYQTITVKPVTRVAAYEEVLVITGSEAEIGTLSQSANGAAGGGQGGAESSVQSEATGGTDAAQGQDLDEVTGEVSAR
ncbi:MAG: rod shape-determining protein MreC [Coriobacteriales bacterium]|jgi:rod shape-determining protein MreC|nr:rod shape-determining protein MreC [Coriobacteriales bacterium]